MHFFIRQNLLFGETLCYLRNAMSHQWSLCFLVSPVVLLTKRHVVPVVTYFFLLFQGFPGAGSSTSKSAGLHADLWIIAPVRLFIWITAIHKRVIRGRFSLRSSAGQSRNISFYSYLVLRNISFEISASYVFELSS